MVSQRITIRLDETLARKVQRARKQSGKSTTELVREGLDRYCEQLAASDAGLWDLMEAVGFVACASGPANLSESYKQDLARSVGKKH